MQKLISKSKVKEYPLELPSGEDAFFCIKEQNGYALGCHYKLMLHFASLEKDRATHLHAINGMEVLQLAVKQGLRTMDYNFLDKVAEERFGFWYRTTRGLPLSKKPYTIGIMTASVIDRFLKMGQLMIRETVEHYYSLTVSHITLKEPTGIFSVMFMEDKELNRHALKMY